MSTPLERNTTGLRAILDAVNGLPDAGSDPVLQEKSVTPTKSAQAVTPDTGFDGMSKVNVGAIPDEYIIPSGTVSVTTNGEHNVREAEKVNVNIPTPDPVLQIKTVTPTTSQQNVVPDDGYDGLSKVTVNAMPTATQATPSISVSSGGLITASATQTAGYVASGTKSATEQLTTQAAQTITPGTTDRIIASGTYLTGAQTIKGDANLAANNIKSGVSIFGVAGSYEGSGSGGSTGGSTGGSLETCTVNFSGSGVPIDSGLAFCYQTVENGEVATKARENGVTSPVTVLCGSMLIFTTQGFATTVITVSSGITQCGNITLYGGMTNMHIYQVNLLPGETGTITCNTRKD